MLARKYGPWAVARLARAGQAWLSDPGNASRREDVVAQLRAWAARASGSAAATAGRLADEIAARRRRSVAVWERELIARRMDLEAAGSPSMREAALVAYAEEAEASLAILAEVPRATTLSEIEDALAAERGMLRAANIPEPDRGRALRAVERSLAACRRTVARA